MTRPLRIVHLEDDPNDVTLIDMALRRDGLACQVANVSTRAEFVAALEAGDVDLVLSDYALPAFDGLSALALARELAPDAPFILVSGTLGEEAAIESLRSGATDYVLKHRLNRLAPAVRRAFEEATERRSRRAAERALDRERNFLRALLDSLEVGVVACNQDGTLTFFNRATREMYGLPPGPVPPDQWASHYCLCQSDGKTPLTADEIPLHRALHGERLRHCVITILHKNREARIVSASGQPIVDARGQRIGAVIAMQDVTEHRKLEQQFHQAQKMEAMGRLAAGVAHDFNNLLTVIGGYCQLAMARHQPVEAEHHDLAEIAKAGDRAANLTRQLLAFSRQQVLEARPLDLNRVVAEMEEMLRRLIGADVELVFSASHDLGQIRADAGQIVQVLMNLVVNARDAMPEGGRITIETSNVERTSADFAGDTGRRGETPPVEPATAGAGSQAFLALTVSDTGSGMDADTVARIFEPFFTTKAEGRGTGLGLSTVHGIVTQSGGHISVRSEPGQGTSFQLLFPRIAQERGEHRPVGQQAAPRRGSETILVVDDDVALLGLVTEILGLHGYTFLRASDGEAALALIEDPDRSIDVMLTDVVMPRVSGRALAERALALRPDLRVLFMSGYVGDHIGPLGTLFGPRVRFIQKPFDPEGLLVKLREVLDAPDAEAA